MKRWPLSASLFAIVAVAMSADAQSPSLPEPPKFARASGIVVDQQDDRPLPHVTVCFTLDRNGYYDGTNDYCDETDEQGAFRLTDLPPGRYGHNVARNGYIAAEPVGASAVSLSAGDNLRDLKFRMTRAGVITGRVLYADGEPFWGVPN